MQCFIFFSISSSLLFFFIFKPNGPRTVISKERDHMSRESDHLALAAARNRRGSRRRVTNVPPLPLPVSVKMSLFKEKGNAVPRTAAQSREMQLFLSSSRGKNAGSQHKGSEKGAHFHFVFLERYQGRVCIITWDEKEMMPVYAEQLTGLHSHFSQHDFLIWIATKS